MELTLDNAVELGQKHKVGICVILNALCLAILYGNPGVLYDIISGILGTIYWCLMSGVRLGEILVILGTFPALAHLNSVLEELKYGIAYIRHEYEFRRRSRDQEGGQVKIPVTSDDFKQVREEKNKSKSNEVAEKLALQFVTGLCSGLNTSGLDISKAKTMDEFEDLLKNFLEPNEKKTGVVSEGSTNKKEEKEENE